MKKIEFKQKINTRKIVYASLILATVFLFGRVAWADAGTVMGQAIGWIIKLIIQGVSVILIVLVNLLMDVASYSNFIHAEAVTKGWIVVRDVCNMFFVLILLVIAFATILGKEEYNAKKTLPKLIQAAVLINFSKMFCGLMIDVANVMMLTFVNAFKEIGSGNIIDMLGITKVVKIGAGGTGEIGFTQIVSAYIFGLIYVLIATVVVASMLGMLVMRVVMIWIYVVLSPAAFFLQAVPGKGQSYATQWWTRWTSNLIVGPVIAFFLWLSFAALQTNPDVSPLENVDADGQGLQEVQSQTGGEQAPIASEAGTPAALAKFAIAIGLLLGGMKIAQEVGGETGSILGKGMNRINKGRALAVGAVTGFAASQAKNLGRGARDFSMLGAGKVLNSFSKTDKITGKKEGNGVGNFVLQWKDDLQAANKKERVANREKFLKKIGISEKAAEIGKPFLENKNLQGTGQFLNKTGAGAKWGLGAGAATGMLMGTSLGPIGTLLGGGVGAAYSIISKNRYNKAKTAKGAYEAGGKAADETTIGTITNKYDRSTWTTSQKDAVDRMQEYNKNKRIVKTRDDNPAFAPTIGAFKNMTTKKKAAEDWVKVTAANPNYIDEAGKGSFYSSNGINDTWKRRLDELNKGGGDATTATDQMVTGINALDATADLAKLKEIAKLISAYEKGGASIDSATLGRVKNALIAKGQDPATYTNQVLTNYKGVGAGMTVNPGSGALAYDAFAKNSLKDPSKRNARKDVMGVSFAKFNAKAAEMNLSGDIKLDEAAGVNQKIDGVKMDALSMVMSGLIDDEIKALQGVGDEISQQKIGQLNTAKSRLLSGDVSGMSLVNSDVEYGGENDSEKRAAQYNTIQHENMHQAGAHNEDIIEEGANALQEAKLVGRIPQTNQSYDEELGKLIASMERSGSDPETIRKAVADQISKWQPSNAERVIQTEKGERDVLKEVVPGGEIKIAGIEKIQEAIDKLTVSLAKPSVLVAGGGRVDMSINDKNFFYRTFEALKKTIRKGDQTVSEKLKPLSAMATVAEKKKSA